MDLAILLLLCGALSLAALRYVARADARAGPATYFVGSVTWVAPILSLYPRRMGTRLELALAVLAVPVGIAATDALLRGRLRLRAFLAASAGALCGYVVYKLFFLLWFLGAAWSGLNVNAFSDVVALFGTVPPAATLGYWLARHRDAPN